MQNINFETQDLVCAVIPKADSSRIDSHPLRGSRSRQDFVSELLLRALNEPELVRREEAAKGDIPDGYYDAEVRTVARVDSEREVFDVVIRLMMGPVARRSIVVNLWYPPAHSPRRGPQQHFNVAVGLPPHARLFGRELEVEGTRLTVKYWREATPEGFEEHVHFIRATAEEAA